MTIDTGSGIGTEVRQSFRVQKGVTAEAEEYPDGRRGDEHPALRSISYNCHLSYVSLERNALLREPTSLSNKKRSTWYSSSDDEVKNAPPFPFDISRNST